MIPENAGTVNSPTLFKRNFPLSIGFVPVLEPVEHKEEVFLKETARKSLLTHKASRNFRNIWYHYPDNFHEFRRMIQNTWPGMDIKPPEMLIDGEAGSILAMFCPEDRMPREIYWAGFGFQVWCQMLTYMLQSKKSSLFIIDEPDIYLHSDLQRQLVSILHDLGPQIIIATHSTEIISEVESKSILTIHKKRLQATRITNSGEIQKIYQLLGSNANPVLTQLAKTKRVLFVEGKDFQILSLFARKMRLQKIANRSDFAVVRLEGFNPEKADVFSRGIEMTLGMPILKSIILDRDYRSQQEVDAIKAKLTKICKLTIIHDRKEIENYLLNPDVLDRAIASVMRRNQSKNDEILKPVRRSKDILEEICNELRSYVLSQHIGNYRKYIKLASPKLDESTLTEIVIKEFDKKWSTLDEKLKLIPGKEALSRFNNVLHGELKISLTQNVIISEFNTSEIDEEIKNLFQELNKFILL